jgi:pimeloyl-ACP methyl ester carboxylesterase
MSAAIASPVGAASTSFHDIVAAPVRIARTALGSIGYREIGRGKPLLLITGFGASMDSWEPTFVDRLSEQFRVIIFDNAGVGETAALGTPLTISAMADQTSALISSLRLGRTRVLGWSMGGMIAQALAVEHPSQVSRLVLAATQAGTGSSLPVPPAAAAVVNGPNPGGGALLSVLFPPGQIAAAIAYAKGILQYPGYYQASASAKAVQNVAIQAWFAGSDPAGHRVDELKMPTLVADGTEDALDPVSNDHLLAHLIPGAALALYPRAGHAFLFQDAATFVPRLERFLQRG